MMRLRRDHAGSTTAIAYQVWAKEAMEEGVCGEARGFAEDVDRFICNSWPSRYYSCSFCEREFRSAQALGGHMNVHRKDRARLCQSPPSDRSPTCVEQPPTISPVDYASRLSQQGQETLNITGLNQNHSFSDDGSMADMVDLELRLGQKP